MVDLEDVARSKSEPIYMKNYDDIKEAMIEKYGRRGYIGAMAQALSGSESRSSKEYKAARRSVERVETGQYKGFGAKYSAKVPEAGKQLPPTGYKAPGSITMTVRGTQRDGHGGTRERTISATFKGPDAQAFIDDPSYAAIWYEYGVNPELFGDGDYAIDVESVS